jgi:uncharacterized protein (TIGR00251 family)
MKKHCVLPGGRSGGAGLQGQPPGRPAIAAPAAALPHYLRAQPDGTLLSVKLQPRASANELAGALGDELRIKVTAPPVDAAANQALLELLADTLDCPRGRVELVRGHTSRHKTVKLHGFKPEEVVAMFGKGA